MSLLAYLVAVWLFVAGIYGVVTSRHLVHLVMCLSVAQASTYVLLLGIGYRKGGAGADLRRHPDLTPVVDPVVQALTLTDVVVERHRQRAAARARGAGPQALRLGRPRRAQRAAGLMALASLAVVVPLVGAALLAGTTSLRARRRGRRRRAGGGRGRRPVLCLALVARSSEHAVVAWLGGWHPRRGVALGIDLYADPLERRPGAASRRCSRSRACRRLAPGRHGRASLPCARAHLPRRDGRLLPVGRPLHRLRVLRAHERERVRPRRLPRRAARAARGLAELRGHELGRRADAAARHRARLRAHGRAEPRADRRGARPPRARRAGGRRLRPRDLRLLRQGRDRALPLLDGRRLRRGADVDLPALRGRDERARPLRRGARVLDGLRRAAGPARRGAARRPARPRAG